MLAKKESDPNVGQSESSTQSDAALVDVARTIGSTVGSAAAKAEGAAREIQTLTRSVSESAVATTRRLYKRARRTLQTQAAAWKSKAREKIKGKTSARAGRKKAANRVAKKVQTRVQKRPKS